MENKSVPFFRVPFLLVAALWLPVGGAAGEGTLEDIDRLLEVGAVGLALQVIGEEQPRFSASPVGWQRWERRRLEIFESRGRWSAIIERFADYPTSLPDDFSISARESLVRAHLAIGNAETAARIVAQLVWGPAQDTAMVHERSERLIRWRAMLAESRLLAGQLKDAQATVLRYRLDYGEHPDGWRLTYAKALIRADRGSEARKVLAGLETTEVAYMKLLLRARDAGVDPVEMLAEMGPLLGGARLVAAERVQLWASLAAAAARYRDHEVRVTAMEQAVALRAPQVARDRLVAVDPDDLWDAYEDYAAALGNEAHLLVGRFDAWLALAEQFAVAGDVKARALYAYLSNQLRDLDTAGIARAGLVDTLVREPRGLRILGALYLDSRRYPEIADVPPTLRAPLVAYALAESRADLAGQLLAGIDRKARHALPLRWRAPVAVALIGNGRIEAALSMFGDDVDAADGSEPMRVDALVQVALTLQMAGEHAHATRLLAHALALVESPWERRELLLLAAEAQARAGRHTRAARLYIESATPPGGGPADTWSRAARLQAARALAQAGLDADAVGVLESTLADSREPDARIFVEHALRRF